MSATTKKLGDICADQNRTTPKLVFSATLDSNKRATCKVSHDHLREIMGVSNMNAAHIKSLKIHTDSRSNGIVATTLKGGDGEDLPITDKTHFVIGSGENSVCAHHIAMPGTKTSTGDMHLKTLPTDPHGYVAHADLSDEDKKRASLNAGLYPNAGASIAKADMWKGTVSAEKVGHGKRIAIPLDQGGDAGALSAAATRAVLSKASLSTVGGPGAKIIEMPHPETGMATKYLVGGEDAINATAESISKNTAVPKTFANGWQIQVDGSMCRNTRPGDQVHHVIEFNREPLGEAHKVTLMKDLVPAELHGTSPGLMVGSDSGTNNQRYTALMFGKSAANSGAAEITHGAVSTEVVDGEDGN